MWKPSRQNQEGPAIPQALAVKLSPFHRGLWAATPGAIMRRPSPWTGKRIARKEQGVERRRR
jgi:hypothetical protein